MKALFTSLLFLLLFVSCKLKVETTREYISLLGKTMGTNYSVKYFDHKERDFKPEIDSILKEFNQSVSTYIPNSEISQFNRNQKLNGFSSVFLKIFRQAKIIHEKTEGVFDPTVMPLVNAWGFGYKNQKNIPSDIEVDSLMSFVGFGKLNLNKGHISKLDERVQLDFSAIAKGYGVDRVGDFLTLKGVKNFMIEIGGEVVCKGVNHKNENWKIGIETPESIQRSLHQIVELSDVAMATSGNYRNYRIFEGKKFAHTIDPSQGKPVQHSLLSASILAKDCMTADAYATSCMVLGLEKSLSLVNSVLGMEGYFIYSKNGKMEVAYTKGFSDTLL